MDYHLYFWLLVVVLIAIEVKSQLSFSWKFEAVYVWIYLQDEIVHHDKFYLYQLTSPRMCLNMWTKAALTQMMISFQQQVNLTLLVKMSGKAARYVCYTDGVVISLFCVFQLAFIFMYCVTQIQAWAVCQVIWKLKRTTVPYWLQRMALNGRKHKLVTSPQADLKVTISWHNVPALQVTCIETYRLEVLQAPGIYLLTSSGTHPEVHHHWSFIAVMYARGVTGSDDMSYHTFWTENWGVPLSNQAISRNLFKKILRFLHFDKNFYWFQRLKHTHLLSFQLCGEGS